MRVLVRPLTLVPLLALLPFASCRTTPSHSAPKLIDAGFESGALARLPVQGWYSDDLADGRIAVKADSSDRVEGKASLAVEIVRPRGADQGLSSVCQTVDLRHRDATGDLDLSIAMRSTGLSSAKIVVYVWDQDQHAQAIAQRDVAFRGATWERPHLRVHVPAGHEHLGVFVYLPSQAGGRLWLDDASLNAVGGA